MTQKKGMRLEEVGECMNCRTKDVPLYKAWIGGDRAVLCKPCFMKTDRLRAISPEVYRNLGRFWGYRLTGHSPSRRER